MGGHWIASWSPRGWGRERKTKKIFIPCATKMTTSVEPTECLPVDLAVGDEGSEQDGDGLARAPETPQSQQSPRRSRTRRGRAKRPMRAKNFPLLVAPREQTSPSRRPSTPWPPYPRNLGSSLEPSLTFARWRSVGKQNKMDATVAERNPCRWKRSREGPPGRPGPCPWSRRSAARASQEQGLPTRGSQTTLLRFHRPHRPT